MTDSATEKHSSFPSRAGEKVSKKRLAAILGVSARTVVTYTNQGMPIDDDTGKANIYDTAQCVQWLRLQAFETGVGKSNINPRDEYYMVKTEREQLQLEKDRDNLLDRVAVREWALGMQANIKVRIASLKNRITLRLPKLSNAADQADIEWCTNELLHELAREFARSPGGDGSKVDSKEEDTAI